MALRLEALRHFYDQVQLATRTNPPHTLVHLLTLVCTRRTNRASGERLGLPNRASGVG